MAVDPVRLQAYFPRDVYERLRRESVKLGVSMAEVMRQAVQQYLEKGSDIAHPDDPIWHVTELARSCGGPRLRDGADNHDRYIYDEDPK